MCVHVFPTEGSGSGNLSTSSSCSETYTSFSDIKTWSPLLQRLVAAPTQCTFYWSSSSLCTVFNLLSRERNRPLRSMCAIQDILYRASPFLNLRKREGKMSAVPIHILIDFKKIWCDAVRFASACISSKRKGVFGRVGINIKVACGLKVFKYT